MADVVQKIKSVGAWNYFLGWYMDEPLLNKFSAQDVYMFTKHNHDTYQKRYFICFAVEAVAPSAYSDGSTRGHITKETSKYITDAGYDMYWEYDVWGNKYLTANKEMHSRLADDCNIWYIPWAYASNQSTKTAVNTNEKTYITHLNAMYEFLKREEHPGGLMTFTFEGEKLNFYGIKEMVSEGYWLNLYIRLTKIGKEICSTK